MIDKISIIVRGGNGGDGAVSFRREKNVANGGPDGGDGGKGGDVYLEASDDVTDFEHLRHTKMYCGNSGERGSKSNKEGKKGEDLIIKVPKGTNITGLVAKGGLGGIGNARYWKVKLKKTRQRPHGFWDRRERMLEAKPGEAGEERILNLELRILADVGIIGLPNVGKSSLLAALTNAKPKIADYPFTTLEPNLGVLDNGLILADIPGLIEGASSGRGLGIDFLKHISKTKLLVHVLAIDDLPAGRQVFDGLLKNYNTVREEIKKYDPELLKKKEMIVLNKIDLGETCLPAGRKGVVKTLLSNLSKHKMKVLGISCKTGDGLEKLKDAIIKEVKGL